MYQYRVRDGIAMLELVFAIVIMGIVMMSAPMLVSQANKSSLLGTQQEAIAAGATDIGLILTRHWDENDTNESLESPILFTASRDILLSTPLAEVNITGNPIGIRAGMPLVSTRSFLTAKGTRLGASIIMYDGNKSDVNDIDDDDIDDYHKNTHFLNNDEATTTEQGDYLDKTLAFTTTVSYISDAPTGGTYNSATLSFNNPFTTSSPTATSNIKLVTIRIVSRSGVSELDKNITLNAFSCNIGAYSLAERRY